jgi:hypothetical protein
MSYQPISNPLPVSVGSALPAGSAAIGSITNTAFGISGTLPAFSATPTFNIGTAPTITVTGALTDTQLRASAVPVSLASTTITGTVAATQSGTWNIGTVTTLPALVAGSALIGKVGIDQTTPGTTNLVSLAANQSVNNSQINGIAPLMGNGVTGTGSQRVTIASDNTAFAVNSTLTAETTKVIGTVNVAASQTIAVTQATPANLAATVTPIAITKGTQGATGFTTQPLRDAGRAIVNAATAIAGVACVATEALLSLNISRDAAATAAATTHAVTSGKRWRITGLVASVRSSAATVLSGRVSLRMNPSGAVTATSPIIAIASMTQQAAALAEAGDTCTIMFPDGIEFSGTMQIGLSQVCSGTGGVVYASLIGYEY